MRIVLNLKNKKVKGETCNILEEAIKRYRRIIQSMLKRDIHARKRSNRGPHIVEHPSPDFRNNTLFDGFLDIITINLTQACEEKPRSDMVESCEY